jgi:protein O-mannosyl-transferase
MKRPRHRQPGKGAEAGALNSSRVSQRLPGDRFAGHMSPARLKEVCLALLLVVGTILAYQPAWHGGFIWDDEWHVVDNKHLTDPDGLKRIWFSLEAPQYYPLVFTSFRVERALWGLNPTGYHFVNLLLHSASALLLWRLLRQLRVPGAWLAAGVFALHPVCVESVAWITERKNTLSMVFFLLSLLWYLRSNPQKSEAGVGGPTSYANTSPPAGLSPRSWYWLSVLAFVLALLSKTAVAPLPVVFLLIAWWRRGRLEAQDLWRTAPFFLAVMILIPLTVLFEHQAGSGVIRSDSFWSRLAGAGWGCWFYLSKALLPLNLMFVYPRWQINPAHALSYFPGLLVVLCFLLCWRYRRGWVAACLFSLGYYLVMLMPELGFVNIFFMRYSLVSDHWQYHAIIGPIALAAAGLMWAFGRWGSRGPFSRGAASAALLVALALLVRRQSAQYANAETLWREAAARNPDAWLAHDNVAELLFQRGEVEAALASYATAFRLQPVQHEGHLNVGVILTQQRKYAEARNHFLEALKSDAHYAPAYYNLGLLADMQGDHAEALAQYRLALAAQPDHDGALQNLTLALINQGKYADTIPYHQAALRLHPKDTVRRKALATAFAQSSKPERAIPEFLAVLRTTPGDVEARNNLGITYAVQQQWDKAIEQFREVLRAHPDEVNAHGNLAYALASQHQLPEAIEHYRHVLRLAPNDPRARQGLGSALAETGKLEEAAQQFTEALRLSPGDAALHYQLGLVLERQSQREQALAQYTEALRLNPGYPDAQRQLEALSAPTKP